jgi:hypothetical protein
MGATTTAGQQAQQRGSRLSLKVQAVLLPLAVVVLLILLLAQQQQWRPGALSRSRAVPQAPAPRMQLPANVPCFKLRGADAAAVREASAVLDPVALSLLRARAKQLPAVDDWAQLMGRPRSALASVSFAIPRVMHQIWLGSRPPPTALMHQWRCAPVWGRQRVCIGGGGLHAGCICVLACTRPWPAPASGVSTLHAHPATA